MLCERAQELFSDYQEGAVNSAMVVPLESHLEACKDCRSKLEGMREVWTLLDTAPLVEPPPDFRAAVWARIDAAEAERARNKRPAFSFDWRSLFRPATLGWAAAALVVLMLAPVVIPGARTKASLVFPWSLVYSAPSSTSQVTIGESRVTVQDGKKIVELQVSNNGTAPARLKVRLNSSSSAPVTIEAPAGTTDKWYPVGSMADSTTRLEASWEEGNTAKSAVMPISQ